MQRPWGKKLGRAEEQQEGQCAGNVVSREGLEEMGSGSWVDQGQQKSEVKSRMANSAGFSAQDG